MTNGLAARRAANSGKGRGAAGQPEEPSCSQKLGSPASVDVALERGSRGLLFDIVKMEERETWTARFLRSDREIGQTDFDGTFSQEVHTIRRDLRIVSDRCVSSSSKRADVDHSQISNLRV